MNDALKISNILSIFFSMTGLCKNKEKTISFKQQLQNEVYQGRVSPNEQTIVLKLLGIEKANTISREDDPRLYNIFNIFELCTSIEMDKSQIYNYVNGEFKTGRINQNNRDLILEAFNVRYTDTKNCNQTDSRQGNVKYCTLEEILNNGWTIIVYDGNNRSLEKAEQFNRYTGGFSFMLQDPKILKNVKAGNYKIFEIGEKIKIRQYIDRETTPLSTFYMSEDIEVQIDPQEIIQAETVLQYKQKYNTNLWLFKQDNKDKTNIRIDKDKIAEAQRTGNIFKLFRR